MRASERPVLVTGAAGFIGRAAVRALRSRGHRVLALTRPGGSRIPAGDSNVQITECALEDAPLLNDIVEDARPKACLHLAWYAVPGRYLDAEENVPLIAHTVDLARTLAAAGCRRLVGAGTCFEYDLDQPRLAETGATRPATLYAAAKLATFHLLSQLAPRWNLSFAWGRFFYLYGPGENERRLVAGVIDGLRAGRRVPVTTGEQVRDFLHVYDAADAVVSVLESAAEGPVNIGSGEGVTIREVVTEIANQVGGEELIEWGAYPARPDDPASVVAVNDRLLQLGWSRRFSLADGIADTIQRG